MLGTFFTISNDNIQSIINYGSKFVADFMHLIVVIVGLFLGVLVVRFIAHLGK